jgi:hypothetical protein
MRTQGAIPRRDRLGCPSAIGICFTQARLRKCKYWSSDPSFRFFVVIEGVVSTLYSTVRSTWLPIEQIYHFSWSICCFKGCKKTVTKCHNFSFLYDKDWKIPLANPFPKHCAVKCGHA